MAEAFQFDLVSPERLLVSEQVESVIIPGTDGEMTVMARHAPVMTTQSATETAASAAKNVTAFMIALRAPQSRCG